MRIILFSFLLILVTNAVKAQDLEIADQRAFTFYYANDVTGSTDKYYTNGVKLDLTMPIFAKSPFSLNWLKWKNSQSKYHTINVHYDVFTPNLHSELYTDRPFASVMMLGSRHQYVMSEKKLMITSELQMGIIGQAT